MCIFIKVYPHSFSLSVCSQSQKTADIRQNKTDTKINSYDSSDISTDRTATNTHIAGSPTEFPTTCGR